MRNGRIYQRPQSERLTVGSGSSFSRGEYPTPAGISYGSSQNEGPVPHDRPSRGTPSLETWAKRVWPTPDQFSGFENANAKGTKAKAQGYPNNILAEARAHGFMETNKREWGTPQAHERATRPRATDHGVQLAVQANHWETPKVSRGGWVNGRAAGGTTEKRLTLEGQASMWPTHCAGRKSQPRSASSSRGSRKTKG